MTEEKRRPPSPERRRAKAVLDALGAARLDPPDRGFASKTSSVPVLLRTSGLGPGLATLFAKGGTSDEARIATLLASLLLNDERLRLSDDFPDLRSGVPVIDLLDHLVEISESDGLRLQREAIELAIWLKKLANGLADDTARSETNATRE